MDPAWASASEIAHAVNTGAISAASVVDEALGVITARDPLDDFIDAAARALALPVEPDWRPAVAANLRVTLEHAASVEAFALADDAEPAPVFKA